MNINNLVRSTIKNFQSYRSARDEFHDAGSIFLDANENALGSPIPGNYNRYPDPRQTRLKLEISDFYKARTEQIFLGNGSDEAIDLLFRAFCEPGSDKVMLLPPTYGMYGVCADLNGIERIEIPLTESFAIDEEKVMASLNDDIKMIFICSPNNPSGNIFDSAVIKNILKSARGLVIIDEAYQDFSNQSSWLPQLPNFGNLVVLRTFSKAWGLADIRLGAAFAHAEIIEVLNRIKYPYNVNGETMRIALKALANYNVKDRMTAQIKQERRILREELEALPFVERVFPSEANFLLVRFHAGGAIFQHLISQGIIVRDRSQQINCDNCLRITVGSAEENRRLVRILKNYGGRS